QQGELIRRECHVVIRIGRRIIAIESRRVVKDMPVDHHWPQIACSKLTGEDITSVRPRKDSVTRSIDGNCRYELEAVCLLANAKCGTECACCINVPGVNPLDINLVGSLPNRQVFAVAKRHNIRIDSTRTSVEFKCVTNGLPKCVIPTC